MNEEAKVESKSEQAQPRRGHEMAERAREKASAAWSSASNVLRNKPAVGAGVAGAAVLAAGALWGVTEAALAAVTIWAVFRTLTKQRRREEKEPTPTGQPSHAPG